MAKLDYLALLNRGSAAWNEWYTSNWDLMADLTDLRLVAADLTGICLTGAQLVRCDLRYANLSGADLRGAVFTEAKLDRANLVGANLTGAVGLTLEQVNNTIGDETTLLPQGFDPPGHWSGGAGELALAF